MGNSVAMSAALTERIKHESALLCETVGPVAIRHSLSIRLEWRVSLAAWSALRTKGHRRTEVQRQLGHSRASLTNEGGLWCPIEARGRANPANQRGISGAQGALREKRPQRQTSWRTEWSSNSQYLLSTSLRSIGHGVRGAAELRVTGSFRSFAGCS